VDELCLLVFPWLLGQGKRLFDVHARTTAFERADTKVTNTGVIVSHFQRISPVAANADPAG